MKLRLETIIKGLELLADVSDVRISENTPQNWFLLLKEHEDLDVVEAFIHIARTITSDYSPKPTPGDLDKYIKSKTNKSSHEAWEEAFEKCSSLTWGSPAPQFSSPKILRAVQQIGGSMRFSEVLTRDLPFFKSAFIDAYNSILEAEKVEDTRSLKVSGVSNLIEFNRLSGIPPLQSPI